MVPTWVAHASYAKPQKTRTQITLALWLLTAVFGAAVYGVAVRIFRSRNGVGEPGIPVVWETN